MKVATIGFAFLITLPVCADAQEQLLGRYSGNFVPTTRTTGAAASIGLTLVITSMDSGVVKGTARSMSRNCGGDFPMEGKLEGENLVLEATQKGGRAGDCGLTLNLKVDGNKLVGTADSGAEVQLSK